MATKSALSIGLMYKFALSFEKVGGTSRELNFLSENINVLSSILRVASPDRMDKCYVIDCDPTPEAPSPLVTVFEHNKNGIFEWNREVVEIYQPSFSDKPQTIEQVLKMCNPPVFMNATVLDCIENNNSLIPDKWKGKKVFFLGTIFSDGTNRYVRCMEWHERSGSWWTTLVGLGSTWDLDYFAAILNKAA